MSLKNALGGVLFIAGTSIGAGLLALPLATAELGFIQTAVIYLVTWLFMTAGAIYILEVNLCIGYGTNLVTMADSTLGTKGKIFTWIVYLGLFYSLMAAYLAGTGSWINTIIPYSWKLPSLVGAAVSSIITFIIIMLGTHISDWCNRVIMIGLISSFVALLVNTAPFVDNELLFATASVTSLSCVPLIITSFGFAIIVPTLSQYLHGNARQLCQVILWGSLCPLVLYIIWELIILGIIPLQGENGLLALKGTADPVVGLPQVLQRILQKPVITTSSAYFSIFALTSSMLGVAISLFDFIADGTHISKNIRGKLVIGQLLFCRHY